MNSLLKTLALSVVIVVSAFVASTSLSNRLEQARPALPESYVDSDLTINGSRLKGFALGMEGLLADWYWMRALQYVGDKLVKARAEDVNLDDLRNLNPRLLYPYLENATDLDPQFIAPYSYGALVMPAIDPEKAIAITRKGIRDNPGQWRLYQYLAYIYWRLDRYEEAAEAYDRGSEVPGAHPFMKLMSASMRTEGGSRATAREIFRQMLAGSNDPAVELTAARRLAALDSLDEREAIDHALAEFKQANGRCPSRFSEVLPLLAKVELPGGRQFRVDTARNIVDPTDIPYLLDQQNCKALIDTDRSDIPAR